MIESLDVIDLILNFFFSLLFYSSMQRTVPCVIFFPCLAKIKLKLIGDPIRCLTTEMIQNNQLHCFRIAQDVIVQQMNELRIQNRKVLSMGTNKLNYFFDHLICIKKWFLFDSSNRPSNSFWGDSQHCKSLTLYLKW